MNLKEFVRESNKIEGIVREPTNEEVEIHRWLLGLNQITTGALASFVAVVAEAPLRDKVGMDVYVGDHVPPAGGPDLKDKLEQFLERVSKLELSAYEAHIEYETLHPFMDGNGRSGRAVWAWMMNKTGQNPFSLPFLHRWYYQSLDESQVRTGHEGV